MKKILAVSLCVFLLFAVLVWQPNSNKKFHFDFNEFVEVFDNTEHPIPQWESGDSVILYVAEFGVWIFGFFGRFNDFVGGIYR